MIVFFDEFIAAITVYKQLDHVMCAINRAVNAYQKGFRYYRSYFALLRGCFLKELYLYLAVITSIA